MKITLSKKQWETMGKIAGWMKSLTGDQIDSWIEMEKATLKQKIREPKEYKEIYVSDDKQHTLEVEYEKFWELKSERGAGYGFQCTPDGRLTQFMSDQARIEISSGNCKDPIVKKIGREIRSGCPCGSGLPPHEEQDARGISIGYVCDKCEKEKLAKYRPEVLTDPNYEADEPIEPQE